MMRNSIFNKNLFSTGLTGFIAVVIILTLSIAIGVSVYINMNSVFGIAKPPLSNAKIRIMCYLIGMNITSPSTVSSSNSSYLCLVSNPLAYNVKLRLYLSGRDKPIELNIDALAVKPLFCNVTSAMCRAISTRILYAEAALSDYNDQELGVEIVYR
jgi:hypothetical protein